MYTCPCIHVHVHVRDTCMYYHTAQEWRRCARCGMRWLWSWGGGGRMACSCPSESFTHCMYMCIACMHIQYTYMYMYVYICLCTWIDPFSAISSLPVVLDLLYVCLPLLPSSLIALPSFRPSFYPPPSFLLPPFLLPPSLPHSFLPAKLGTANRLTAVKFK